MYTYGCEFIDDGCYGESPPRPKEPWKRYSDAFLLPIEYVLTLADQRYISEVSVSHKDYIDELIQDIKLNGLREPLILTINSTTMKLSFYDGNHRLIAMNMRHRGKGQVPVRVQIVKGRHNAGGVSLEPFLPVLVAHIAKTS